MSFRRKRRHGHHYGARKTGGSRRVHKYHVSRGGIRL